MHVALLVLLLEHNGFRGVVLIGRRGRGTRCPVGIVTGMVDSGTVGPTAVVTGAAVVTEDEAAVVLGSEAGARFRRRPGSPWSRSPPRSSWCRRRWMSSCGAVVDEVDPVSGAGPSSASTGRNRSSAV